MNHIQVELSCGHHARKDVPMLDVYLPVHCMYCDAWQSIETIFADEWHASCNHCQYARWTGQDYPRADRYAQAHESRRPGHAVTVKYERVAGAAKLDDDAPRNYLRAVAGDGTLF